MNYFRHVDAATIEEAVELLGGGDARIIAGGTNILPLMKLGIAEPATLVNVKDLPEIGEITFDEKAGLRIGALATIDTVANHGIIRDRYPLLGQAAAFIASPQIRNVATVGGNLTQEPRCWYYRGVHPCWLKGGRMCYAAAGENEKHAILGAGTCNSVQPSDLAPALVALDARAEIASPQGIRSIPVEQLFQTPTADSRRLSTLKPDELITRIDIPPPSVSDVSGYVKKMERHIWTFASASLAARLCLDGGVVADSHLVFGGVSQTPWRVIKAEEILKGKPLNEVSIEAASKASTAGAQSLKHNGYKLRLAQAIVTEALERLRPLI